ncbi:hypothetical protein KIW84_062998 [Lathyrus oleraceus]|uniref:Uncharacterized protein n=1 Tax=Pisum sativum TaxID=3888 RepID=A0A9D4W6J1_PEA|nr:hypothetical protein KIW84_062998 [Pisum sativum]
MVNMGMRLEEGVREGRLTKDEGSSSKRYGAFAKKKDGEAHAVQSHVKPRRPSVKRKPMRSASNQHQVAHIAPVFRDNQQYHHQHNNNQQSSQQYQQQHRPQQQAYQPHNSSPASTSYERDPPAIPANPQWWYKPDQHCVYHSGAPGHNVENCFPLKTKVQDLMRCGILSFEDAGPNVTKNPLPEHGKSVNMVQGCPGKYKNRNVDEDEPEVNVISPVFRIPEPVIIRYDGSKQKVSPSLIIKPAGPVPYSSDRAIPFRYNAVVVEDGKEVPLPSPSVLNIADVSGLTRSGRVFSAPPKPQAVADPVARPVGNAVNSPNPAPVVKPSSVQKTLASVGPSGNLKEDRDEMLRLIKKSEYSVVDQLLQTTSKISVLSLLLNSEPHREALQKVLDVAYVDHDVTIEQFDSIVANITACNTLSFCDSDLPEEGRDHNLALHISMNCKDDAMSNVLVDTGSSLNVLPKSTLLRLSFQGPPMRQSGVVVKAFDGPWLHEAGAVTSTLHQKLKFVKNKKLVVVGGEKALLVSHLSSFSYIDAEDEVGTPFQALSIAEPVEKKTPSFASYRDAKLAIKCGAVAGLGKMIELEDNKSRAGIGFSSGVFNDKGLFKSGGFIHAGQSEEATAVLEEDVEDTDNFVIPGGICHNWVAVDVPTVIHRSE